MKMISALARVLILGMSLATAAAHADILWQVTGAVALTDPTTQGRLSRNGIPQDWAGSEDFPGVINPGVTYHYTTYFVNVGLLPFLQIDFDAVGANTFIMAYQGSYDAAHKDINWLGDAGFSGNAFGTDPNFFNVIADVNSVVAIVVAATGARDAGVGDPFHIIVEGYYNANFLSTADLPEPSPLLLCFVPLMVLLGQRAWRDRRLSREMSGAV